MTNKYWLRSTIFNLLFYSVTLIACIACMPTLLMPRKAFMFVVHSWTGIVHFLERTIMGLRFQLRGSVNLPSSGSYIIASKHQSAYETMKLHALFGDPAIILKQELLKIPLWGKYLKKINPIAIDRSNPDAAITSMQMGAQAVKEQGRPIVIFPQGTRVWPHETAQAKPYKVGVARIQEATNLPIIPLALNTGHFWPRSGWCKRPGTIIFEFLPAIEPGMDRAPLISRLENNLESHSNALLAEAQNEERLHLDEHKSALPAYLFGSLILLFTLYSVFWFWLAGEVKERHSLFMVKTEQADSVEPQDLGAINRTTQGVRVSGYPGPVNLLMARESFVFPTGKVQLENVKASSWPLPFVPVHVECDLITLQSIQYAENFTFERGKAKFTPFTDHLEIDHLFLEQGDLQILVKGTITKGEHDIPNLDLVVTIKRADIIIDWLIAQRALNERTALFVSAGLKALEKDGVVTMPVTTKAGDLYAGPFLIGKIPF